jgi:hypothetical protein
MADRLTDEQYAAIETAYPSARLKRIPTAAGEIVIRAPTATEEGQFQQMYAQTDIPGAAWKNLLIMVTVYPDRQTMSSWLSSWTGLAINPKVIRALKMIRGEADEEEAK